MMSNEDFQEQLREHNPERKVLVEVDGKLYEVVNIKSGSIVTDDDRIYHVVIETGRGVD